MGHQQPPLSPAHTATPQEKKVKRGSLPLFKLVTSSLHWNPLLYCPSTPQPAGRSPGLAAVSGTGTPALTDVVGGLLQLLNLEVPGTRWDLYQFESSCQRGIQKSREHPELVAPPPSTPCLAAPSLQVPRNLGFLMGEPSPGPSPQRDYRIKGAAVAKNALRTLGLCACQLLVFPTFCALPFAPDIPSSLYFHTSSHCRDLDEAGHKDPARLPWALVALPV